VTDTDNNEQPEAAPAPGEEEELEDFDYVDPLKRDEELPGLDPIVPPVPPES
jgi:hypothetical protein